MRSVVLVLLAGCGRVGFDALDVAPIDAAPPLDSLAVSACRWTDATALPGLMMPGTEWEPALSPDGQTLLFASDPELYRSVRGADGWSQPDQLGLPGGGKHGPAWVSNTRFYFSLDTSQGPRLRVADFEGGGIAVQDVLGLEAVPVLGPSVADDELELFYTTAVPATNADIGHATRPDRASAWTVDPARVLSTTASEGWPSLSRDGTTLFFESDRGRDTAIWLATRAARGAAWSAPMLAPGLHVTGADEGDPEITADGTLLFASDRDDPGKNINLYAAACR